MDAVTQIIKSALPEVADDDLTKVVSRLVAVGVANVGHLGLVREEDIAGCLRPIQTRVLLQRFQQPSIANGYKSDEDAELFGGGNFGFKRPRLLDFCRELYRCSTGGHRRRRRRTGNGAALIDTAERRGTSQRLDVADGTTPPNNCKTSQDTCTGAEVLRRHKDALCELLDPDFGLLDLLVSRNVFQSADIADVQAETSVYKRNSRIVDCLVRARDSQTVESFLRCLEQAKQQHLVNFIRGNGVVDASCGDERPLLSKHVDRLVSNRPAIIETLDVSDSLLDRLESRRCLTWRHKEHFKQTVLTGSRRSQDLLDLVRKGSVGAYKRFLNCLREDDQGHVVDIVKRGGAVVDVDAKLSGDVTNLKTTEHRIVNRLKKIVKQFNACNLDETQQDGLESMLRELNELRLDEIELVDARTQNSIGLSFYCRSPRSFHKFNERFASGSLRKTAEVLFNALSARDRETVNVDRLLFDDEDSYGRLFKHVTGNDLSEQSIADCEPSGAEQKTHETPSTADESERVAGTPTEIVELILMKAAVGLWTDIERTDPRPQQPVYVTMTSVCYEWYDIIVCRRWFRRHLRRIITELHRPFRNRIDDPVNVSTNGLAVWGVAWVDGRIYVICARSSVISVIEDGSPFGQVDSIDVVGLGEAWDMVACTTNRCLYVADFKNACVWRISASDQRCSRWLSTGLQWPWTMWVADDGRVLMIHGDPPRLDIYQSDAQLVSTLSLPADVTSPLHAVEIGHIENRSTDGKSQQNTAIYAVSHGRLETECHRLCQLAPDGSTLRSYGSTPGKRPGELNGPGYLCAIRSQLSDARNATRTHIAVAEYHNSRITVFDDQIRGTLRVLVQLTDKDRPRRLCVVPSSGLLVVGLSGGGGVNIYNVMSKQYRQVAKTTKGPTADKMAVDDRKDLKEEQQRLMSQLGENVKMRRLMQILQQLGQQEFTLRPNELLKDKARTSQETDRTELLTDYAN